MASTATAHRLFASRPSSGALLDIAVAAAMFGGSLALIRHGGIGPSRPGSGELDLIGVVLGACSTVPLIAWRRSPIGVFAVTSAAGVLLAGLGYPVDLLLGPTAALYLLAASRERQTPWTRRTTVTVVGLLVAYLGATAAAQEAFPGIELLHTGLAWAVAWFAGERTRLRREQRSEQIAELRERALRAEREAERERQLRLRTREHLLGDRGGRPPVMPRTRRSMDPTADAGGKDPTAEAGGCGGRIWEAIATRSGSSR